MKQASKIASKPANTTALALTLAAGFGLLACTKVPDQPVGDPPASGSGGTGGKPQGSGGAPAGSGGSPGSGGSASGGSTGSGGSAPTGSGGSTPGTGGTPAPTDGGTPSTDSGGPGGPPAEPGTPGATDLTKHKFSKVIKMDTTAAGAGVMPDIAGFPVAVLLGDTFDFSQAKPQGQDVRFATMDGTLLPYSIELWDPAGKKGALWVRVDVKGNNNTQAFVMHWGNPDAESAASSKTVFNKEAGFLGVWHLNEDGNAEPNGYKDSSWNEVHGTGIKMIAGSTAAARIGLGTKFNNEGGGGANVQWVKVDGPKIAQDFNGNEHPISATIWANATSWKGYYETYFSKGDRSWTLQRDYQGRVEACQYVGYHACAITAKPTVNEWVHWMLVQKKGSIAIFKNGVRVAGAGGNTQYGDHPFGIGNQTQYNMGADWKRGFHGLIDEVRVMGVEKDAYWAKLDYESQREGSKFLTLEATVTK